MRLGGVKTYRVDKNTADLRIGRACRLVDAFGAAGRTALGVGGGVAILCGFDTLRGLSSHISSVLRGGWLALGVDECTACLIELQIATNVVLYRRSDE
jgi:hypothetical protein